MDAVTYRSRRYGQRDFGALMRADGDAPDLSALILAVAREGDRASFARLFEALAPRVKAYLLRLGAAQAQADEWVQETFLIVWRKAGRFDPEKASASTWIFTIARNLRIDAARRDGRALTEDPFDREAGPSGDDLVFAAERDERVLGALEALPPDQVQVIRLSFFEDRPHSEIAESLGLPLGTVKSRLRLAMNRLRAALEDLR